MHRTFYNSVWLNNSVWLSTAVGVLR